MSDADEIANEIQAALGSAMHAELMMSLVDSDLLSLIRFDGSTITDLIDAGFAEQPIRLFADALTASGYLERRDGRYFVPVAVRSAFSRDNGQLAGSIRLVRERQRVWAKLPDVLTGADVGDGFYGALHEGPLLGDYLSIIERANADIPAKLVHLVERHAPTARRILNLGGGHCRHALALLEAMPETHVDVFDLPGVIDHVAQTISHDRLTLIAGDALELDLPGVYDLAVINNVFHFFDDADEAEILRRCVDALEPGGTILVTKYALDQSGLVPTEGALLSLQWYLTTGGGWLETDTQAAEMLLAAGAVDVGLAPVNDRTSAIIGRRPV